VVTASLKTEITRTIIEPTVATLRDRGIDYRGVLYAGLMIRDGRPKVLEYNVRFGDPECQPLMVRLRSSLVDLVEACVEGDLAGAQVEWNAGAAVCLVMASGGYPGAYEKGKTISGIEDAAAASSVEVFHAGTSRDADGNWVTAGGRVLGVTAGADTIAAAVGHAYEAAAKIEWEGVHYRRDIAHRALSTREI